MTKTQEQLIQLIVTKLGAMPGDVSLDKPMSEFGLDSLSQVELLFLIEDHFDIKLPDSLNDITTLQGLSTIIDQSLSDHKQQPLNI